MAGALSDEFPAGDRIIAAIAPLHRSFPPFISRTAEKTSRRRHNFDPLPVPMARRSVFGASMACAQKRAKFGLCGGVQASRARRLGRVCERRAGRPVRRPGDQRRRGVANHQELAWRSGAGSTLWSRGRCGCARPMKRRFVPSTAGYSTLSRHTVSRRCSTGCGNSARAGRAGSMIISRAANASPTLQMCGRPTPSDVTGCSKAISPRSFSLRFYEAGITEVDSSDRPRKRFRRSSSGLDKQSRQSRLKR